MASLVAPVIEKVTAGVSRTQPNAVTAIGSKVTGAETGAVMSFLASKVLGQYDLAPQGVPRLLLVAPNIVQTERELKVDTRDFRLWVAMHEETHRVQFTAVPWLRDHMIEPRPASCAVDIAPTPDELAGRVAGDRAAAAGGVPPRCEGLAEVLLDARSSGPRSSRSPR